jgi:hypothetical protein
MHAPLHRIAGVVVLACLASAGALAQGPDRMIGRWELNVAKSTFNPGPGPKSDIRTYEDRGGITIITLEGVNAQGNPTYSVITVKYDGKDYPIVPRNGETTTMISYKRVDANALAYTTKQGGKVLVNATKTLSADGRTMTHQIKGTNAQGQAVNNMLVFEKR